MNWREITCKEADAIVHETPGLTAFSGFTDTEGTHPLGYGYPVKLTTWGVGDEEVLREEYAEPYPGMKRCHHYLKGQA